MEVVKDWARSVSLVAVLCSMILMLAPERMKRNVAFVLEIIVLTAVVAPAWRWISLVRARPASLVLESYLPRGTDGDAFRRLYLAQTRRQVEALVQSLGLSVSSLELEVDAATGNISRITIVIPPREAGASEAEARGAVFPDPFRKLVSLYTGVPESSVIIEFAEGGK
ncbi:MAG: hypothetical protein IMW97_07170 [Firmicutes bacterium]|nr:hypothetical protein [Candidatus Fermentithermobacillaceae bacterium]